ncbi:hypothetical protein GCM10010240_35920 [Streptomyces griseoviridis]|nr:hypothetical protein GCM10010240_35920 [Streptomyces griseoviridis]
MAWAVIRPPLTSSGWWKPRTIRWARAVLADAPGEDADGVAPRRRHRLRHLTGRSRTTGERDAYRGYARVTAADGGPGIRSRTVRGVGRPGATGALWAMLGVSGAVVRPATTEVRDVTHAVRTVRLRCRRHIDLQRVAGALCRS